MLIVDGIDVGLCQCWLVSMLILAGFNIGLCQRWLVLMLVVVNVGWC